MNAIIIAILTTFTLTPKVTKEPTLRSISRNEGTYELINPTRRPIIAQITCGLDWESIKLTVPARTTMQEQFLDPLTQQAMVSCYLEDWWTISKAGKVGQ